MIIYHYTSMDTATKILEKHSIWASDITRSNDYMELNMIYPDIYEALFVEHEKHRTVDFSFQGKTGLTALQNAVIQVKRQIDGIIEYGDLLTYVLCFSEGKDMLSQWRSYADDGRGVAIGFEAEELENYALNKSSDTFALRAVEYIGEDRRRKIVEEKAYSILKLYKDVYDQTGKFPSDKTSVDGIKFMISWFMQETIHLKPKGFEEEKEWRLFVRNVAPSNNYFAEDFEGSGLKRYVGEHMEYCVKNGVITTYIPINLDVLGENPIKSVVLGPTNNTTERDLKFFLEKNGYQGVEVERSAISYRR